MSWDRGSWQVGPLGLQTRKGNKIIIELLLSEDERTNLHACKSIEHLLLPFMMMAMIMPYMPRIPAMTTGMIDLKIRSGLSAAVSTIPSPALAVPNAAPKFEKMIAQAIPSPPNPIA